MRLSHRVAAKKQLAAEGQREVVKYLHFKRLHVLEFQAFLSVADVLDLTLRRLHQLKLDVEVLIHFLAKANYFCTCLKLPARTGRNSPEQYFAEEYLNLCRSAPLNLH